MQVHFELRKWFHANVSPEVAATIRIIYGGLFISSVPHPTVVFVLIAFSSYINFEDKSIILTYELCD